MSTIKSDLIKDDLLLNRFFVFYKLSDVLEDERVSNNGKANGF